MQRLRSNKILGMAMTEQGILLAEVVVSGGRRELVKAAEFPYPGGTLPADLTTIGRPLAAFLRQQGFGSRQAVIGLPARWVMVKSTEIPPSDRPSAAKILRLQAETAFSSELKELVYDYAGEPDRNQANTVLLMAVAKQRLNQIEEMATLARLTVRAIMPSVAAIGSAMPSTLGQERLVLHIGPRAVELAAYHGNELERMRHVMTLLPNAVRTGQFPAELGVELRRSIASMPINGTAPGDRRLLLWDELAHDDLARQNFGTRLGIAVDSPSLAVLGVQAAAGLDDPKYAAPAALGCAGLADENPAVDFLHSRMFVPKEKKSLRLVVWVSLAVILAAAGMAYLVVDTKQTEEQVATLTKTLEKQRPEVEEANKFIAKAKFAASWILPDVDPKTKLPTRDKRYRACWAGVSQAFPPNYAMAYVRTFELHTTVIPAVVMPASGKTPARTVTPARTALAGQMSGSASTPAEANAIGETLRRNGKFEDVKVIDVREVGNTGRQVTFSITFNYNGTE